MPTSRARVAIVRALCITALFLGCSPDAVAVPHAEWNFAVSLDGRPIGTHRFTLAPVDGDSLGVQSEARFDVTWLGVTLYHYRHRATERWAAGCLASIDARTDDNGRLTEVRGSDAAGRFEWEVRDNGRTARADAPRPCVMSFAYWNPALRAQVRLLDPGSGSLESVAIAPADGVPADLATRALPVRGLRIGGLAHPIDVWYVGERWVGLDTTVRGGRHLSYRLQ